MNTAKKSALIVLGYAIAIAAGFAAVTVNETAIPASTAQGSPGMVAFGDMVLFVPDSPLFANNQYVYLYSEFGCGNEFTAAKSCQGNQKYPSGAGFEEWWVPGSNTVFGTAAVPEPATLFLSGTGLLLFARRYRRRR